MDTSDNNENENEIVEEIVEETEVEEKPKKSNSIEKEKKGRKYVMTPARERAIAKMREAREASIAKRKEEKDELMNVLEQKEKVKKQIITINTNNTSGYFLLILFLLLLYPMPFLE